MKIGIVVSKTYWEELTGKMLDLAVQTAEQNNIEVEVIKVPGSFDIPLPVKRLLRKDDVDGVVTLGAIIQGVTSHDEVISYSITKSLVDLSLDYDKPVVLGINGPRMSKEQAVERIPRAEEVMKACIEMVRNR